MLFRKFTVFLLFLSLHCIVFSKGLIENTNFALTHLVGPEFSASETRGGYRDAAFKLLYADVNFVAQDTTVCSGSLVDLTSLVDNYATILNPIWHIGTTDGTIESTPVSVSPVIPTDYFLIGDDVQGFKDTVTVSVLHFSVPDVTLTNDSICPGLQGTLDAGSHTSYLWSTGSTAQTISVDQGTYWVTVTDGNSCTASATAQIVEYNAPNLTHLQIMDNSGIANDSVVCHGENLSFGTNVDFGTGTAPNTLSWTATPSGNASFFSATDGLFAGLNFSNSGIAPISVLIKINVSDANGCLDSLSIPIQVRPQFDIDSIGRFEMSGTPNDGGICFGDSILFVVSPGLSGDYSYNWNTGETNDSIWVQPPYIGTNTVYFVTVTDTYGCSAASFTAAKGIPEMFSTTTFIPACSSSDPDTLSFVTSGGVPTTSGYLYTISTLTFPDFNDASWKLPINVAVGNDVIVSVKDEKGCPIDTILTVPVHTDLMGLLNSTACRDNNTPMDETDDYFMATITASNTSGGLSGKYLLIYDGTTLNSGGTDYGMATTIGSGQEFAADGTSTFTITVQDLDSMGCAVDLTIGAVGECSECPLPVCLPIQVLKE